MVFSRMDRRYPATTFVGRDASLSDYFRQKRRFQMLDFVSVGFFVFVVNAIVTSICTRTALPSFGRVRSAIASERRVTLGRVHRQAIERFRGVWVPVPINHASEEQRSIDTAPHGARRVLGFDVANESRRGHPISRLVNRVVLLRDDRTNEQAERERNATHCRPHVHSILYLGRAPVPRTGGPQRAPGISRDCCFDVKRDKAGAWVAIGNDQSPSAWESVEETLE